MKRVVFLILLLINSYAYSQELRVGVITAAPPFAEVAEAGNQTYFFGFSIDVMTNVCKQLKLSCVFKPLTLQTQFSSLNNGTVDVILLANPYEFSRLSNYAVSLPYLISTVQFAARADSPIKKGSVIDNYKIGVMKTTFYDLLINSPYKKNNTIVPFGTVTDLITALNKGKVDIIVLNSAIALYFINNGTYKIKTVSPPISLGDGYGIIALPNKKPLIKAINKALLNMQSNGSYLSLYSRYHDGM